MAEKQKVSYEIRTIDQPQTLVLERPASLHFINVSQIIGNTLTINQDYTLQCYRDFVSGVATFPSELILNNNSNEQDTTVYRISGTPNEFICKIIIKYLD